MADKRMFMMMAELIVDDGKPYRCEAYFTADEFGDVEFQFIKTHSPMQRMTREGLSALGSVVELKLSYFVKGGDTDGVDEARLD